MENLRKLVYKIDASGSVTTLESTNIYQDSFMFVGLRVLVPVLSNTENAVVSTYRTVNNNGVITNYSNNKFALVAVGNDKSGLYRIFERPLPKEFCEDSGEVDINFLIENINSNKVVSRLTAKTRIDVIAADYSGDYEFAEESNIALGLLNDLSIDVANLDERADTLEQRVTDIEDFSGATEIGELGGRVDALESGKADKSDIEGFFTSVDGELTRIENKISNIEIAEIVTDLPVSPKENKLYLKLAADSDTNDIYEEWIFINEEWEKLGTVSASVDLSDYATRAETEADLHSKVESYSVKFKKGNDNKDYPYHNLQLGGSLYIGKIDSNYNLKRISPAGIIVSSLADKVLPNYNENVTADEIPDIYTVQDMISTEVDAKIAAAIQDTWEGEY